MERSGMSADPSHNPVPVTDETRPAENVVDLFRAAIERNKRLANARDIRQMPRPSDEGDAA